MRHRNMLVSDVSNGVLSVCMAPVLLARQKLNVSVRSGGEGSCVKYPVQVEHPTHAHLPVHLILTAPSKALHRVVQHSLDVNGLVLRSNAHPLLLVVCAQCRAAYQRLHVPAFPFMRARCAPLNAQVSLERNRALPTELVPPQTAPPQSADVMTRIRSDIGLEMIVASVMRGGLGTTVRSDALPPTATVVLDSDVSVFAKSFALVHHAPHCALVTMKRQQRFVPHMVNVRMDGKHQVCVSVSPCSALWTTTQHTFERTAVSSALSIAPVLA
eukprot:PhF_6_TR15925/c0_g1_i1/m.24681